MVNKTILSTPMLVELITTCLEDKKAEDVVALTVKNMTTITDVMMIASGTSSQHLRAMSQHLYEEVKKQGVSILGVEGESNCDWILLDFGSVIVHLMLPAARAYYELEKLWHS